MRKLYGKLLDALLGKRYHPGWPRGVLPIGLGLLKVKEDNPEFWAKVANDPAYSAIAKLRKYGIIV